MKKTTKNSIISLVFAGAIAGACGTSAQRGDRGESCETRNDCKGGLACVANVCSEGEFQLNETNKECVPVQCRSDGDCCPEPPDICTQLEEQCASGDQFSCDQRDQICVCNTRCENDTCVNTCGDGQGCPGGQVCDGARCVDCACDDQCGDGFRCRNAQCVPECERDGDCPGLHECRDNACVRVGCKSDRECIAALNDVLAFCEDSECLIACQADVECDNPLNYGFRACIRGACRSVGCDSDQECRILLGGNSVCREGGSTGEGGFPGVGGPDCPMGGMGGVGGIGGDCGNGFVDIGEDCDSFDLNGQTCATLTGLPEGVLGCTPFCTYDTSDCRDTGGDCGNGLIDFGEDCDGFNLDGETCDSATFGARPLGSLACDGSCNFDTSGCIATGTGGTGGIGGTGGTGGTGGFGATGGTGGTGGGTGGTGGGTGGTGGTGGGTGGTGGMGGVPSTWNCDSGFYGSGDGCDCGCGEVDPDCMGNGCAPPGCFVTGCGFCYDAGGQMITCPGGTGGAGGTGGT